jgi:hypothetical protein
MFGSTQICRFCGGIAVASGQDAAGGPARSLRWEDGPLAPLADGQADGPGGPGCERDGHDFAALAGDGQRPMPALGVHGIDVGRPTVPGGQRGGQRIGGIGRGPRAAGRITFATTTPRGAK